MRSLAHRQMDWSKPIFKGDSEIVASINKFRGFIAKADAMAEEYSAPPSNIDFASAKSKIRSKDLVENLEKFYSKAELSPETYVWSAENQAEKDKIYESAVAQNEALNKDIEYYKEYLEKLKANRTTRDTTLSDIKSMYPEIAAQVEKEVDNREWFKDVVEACRSPVDASKEKAALIERYPDHAEFIEAEFERVFPSN